MALVDVVIPVYQRAALAREAVLSVLNQSITDITLVVVEDGTQPNSEQNFSNVAAEFYSDTRFKHIVLEKNSGPSVARNRGAAMGSSPYIAFLDSDDLWNPDKLQKQIDFLGSNPDIQWVHTGEVWIKNGTEIKQKKEHKKQNGIFINKLFERCLISPSAVLFRRPFWNKYGAFPEYFRVAEDYSLWLHLNFRFPVGYIEEPLTIKRAGSWPQLSSTIGIDHYRVLALHKFFRLFRNDPVFPVVADDFFNEVIRKTNLLLKGALKYKNVKAKTYQRWLALFTTLRTRAMSLSSEGTERNSSE